MARAAITGFHRLLFVELPTEVALVPQICSTFVSVVLVNIISVLFISSG